MRDMSVEGIYVVASGCPPENSTVRCRVLLPPLDENAAPTAFMVANTVGKVLRRERGGLQAGFAVRNRALVLRTRDVVNDSSGRRDEGAAFV